MTTYNYSNFPIAIVAFGNGFSTSDYEKHQDYLTKLKAIAEGITQVSVYSEKELVTTAAQIAGKVAPVLTVLIVLVGEVDELHNKLKNLDQKIFNINLQMKIRSLTKNLNNLESKDTNEVQRVAEIVTAISHLNEILELFSNTNSIFRERFYHGAPLFVGLCPIVKGICLIAGNTTDYNNSSLQNLKQEYQDVLNWYRNKCIGSRMASCYVKPMLSLDYIGKSTNDWNRHYKIYNEKYYEEDTIFPYFKYGQNLGGCGWRLWRGQFTFCTLIDPWDTRTHDEVKFEPMGFDNTLYIKFIPGPGDRRNLQDVLAEYRRRVEEVMLPYFNSVSLVDT